MIRWQRISSSLWSGELGRAWRGDAITQAVGCWLMTSPGNNDVGLYEMEPHQIAGALGFPEGRPSDNPGDEPASTVWGALKRLEAFGFLRYDRKLCVVWVVKQVRHNFPDEIGENDRRTMRLWKLLEPHQKSPLVAEFLAHWGEYLRIDWIPGQATPHPPPTHPPPTPHQVEGQSVPTTRTPGGSMPSKERERDIEEIREEQYNARTREVDSHEAEILTKSDAVGQSALEGIPIPEPVDPISARVAAVHDAMEAGRKALYAAKGLIYHRASPAKKSAATVREMCRDPVGAERLRIAARNLALSAHHAGFGPANPDGKLWTGIQYVLRNVEVYHQLCPFDDWKLFERSLQAMLGRERAKAHKAELQERLLLAGEKPGSNRRPTLEERADFLESLEDP
jgi:hypothetical protein